MALAYALRTIDRNHDLRLTVYGQFLELSSERWQAEIIDNQLHIALGGLEAQAVEQIDGLENRAEDEKPKAVSLLLYALDAS